MNIPRMALGKGFFGHRPKISGAPVYPVNVSNGMPIVSHKKSILEKGKKGMTSSRRNTALKNPVPRVEK